MSHYLLQLCRKLCVASQQHLALLHQTALLLIKAVHAPLLLCELRLQHTHLLLHPLNTCQSRMFTSLHPDLHDADIDLQAMCKPWGPPSAVPPTKVSCFWFSTSFFNRVTSSLWLISCLAWRACGQGADVFTAHSRM
jgi:hypothetical protein